MRVRNRRFQRGRAGYPERHGMIRKPCHENSMLPIGKALIVVLAQSGVIGSDVLAVVDSSLSGSVLPDIESSGLFPARCPVLRPLLTSRGISSSGSPQVRTRCFPARPPHLPPQLNPRLRCVVPTRRIASALLCGSCPSARRFPLAFLSPISYPFGVGFGW